MVSPASSLPILSSELNVFHSLQAELSLSRSHLLKTVCPSLLGTSLTSPVTWLTPTYLTGVSLSLPSLEVFLDTETGVSPSTCSLSAGQHTSSYLLQRLSSQLDQELEEVRTCFCSCLQLCSYIPAQGLA